MGPKPRLPKFRVSTPSCSQNGSADAIGGILVLITETLGEVGLLCTFQGKKWLKKCPGGSVVTPQPLTVGAQGQSLFGE